MAPDPRDMACGEHGVGRLSKGDTENLETRTEGSMAIEEAWFSQRMRSSGRQVVCRGPLCPISTDWGTKINSTMMVGIHGREARVAAASAPGPDQPLEAGASR